MTTKTTVEFDEDVADFLNEECRRQNKPIGQIVNEVVRRQMPPAGASEKDHKPYRVQPFEGGFAPGVDPTKINQLYDQLEIDAFIEKENRSNL